MLPQARRLVMSKAVQSLSSISCSLYWYWDYSTSVEKPAKTKTKLERVLYCILLVGKGPSEWQKGLFLILLTPVQHSCRYSHRLHRHILRDRRPSTTACPACWAMRKKEFEIVYGGEKLFYTGLTRAAKAERKSPVLARQTNQKRTPLIYTLWVPIHFRFNGQPSHPSQVSLQLPANKPVLQGCFLPKRPLGGTVAELRKFNDDRLQYSHISFMASTQLLVN
jgi:hypothetical protein